MQLRDSQTDCTDTECAGPSGDGGSGLNLPMLLALWGVAALVLFMTRPQSLRHSGDLQTAEKPSMDRVSPCFKTISPRHAPKPSFRYSVLLIPTKE